MHIHTVLNFHLFDASEQDVKDIIERVHMEHGFRPETKEPSQDQCEIWKGASETGVTVYIFRHLNTSWPT